MYLFKVFLFILYKVFVLVDCEHTEGDICPDYSKPLFDARVYLFFGPNQTESIRQRVVAYYFNPNLQPHDTLVLGRTDAVTSEDFPVYYYPKTMSGIIYTEFSLPEDSTNTAHYGYKQKCIKPGYWGYWMRNNTRGRSTCLRTHPNWMHQRRHLLRDRTLSSVIIPGTHHSGSYVETYPQSTIHHVTATQDTNVLRQLISGARYFDFRPSGLQTDLDYWIIHGVQRMHPLSLILGQIKDFIDNVDSEVIIISFKQFPYAFRSRYQHIQFISYLEHQLSGYILNRSRKFWAITFKEIWQSKKRRVIISYDDFIYENTSTLWPMIPQKWANAQSIDALYDYLECVETLFERPRASMAELTMDTVSGITHFATGMVGLDHESIINMAAVIGPKITKWYNELFYLNTSIIAVDYIDATGIVEFAIEWNDRRLSPCYLHYIYNMDKHN